MAHSESDRYGSLLRNRFCQQFILLLLLTTLISPMCPADKAKDEETLKNAAKVLTEMLNAPASGAIGRCLSGFASEGNDLRFLQRNTNFRMSTKDTK